MAINFDHAMLFVGLLTEVLLIGLFFYRKVWRILPIFCSYVVWDLCSNIAVYFVIRYKPGILFHAYFAETIIDSALLFCVLVELTWSVLKPLRASLPRSAVLLIAVLILVAGVAIWPFAALPGLAHATTKEGLIFTQLQQTTSILRILFFLLLAGGSQLLSISWRDRELQVATGLGVYSFASLTVAVVNLHQTTALQYERLDQFVVASYVCSLIYWAVSFAQKEAERREFTPQMQRFLLAVAGAARTTRVGLENERESKSQKLDRR